jgi:hypothetical protein
MQWFVLIIVASANMRAAPPPYSPPTAPFYMAPPPAYAPPQSAMYSFVPYQTFPSAPPGEYNVFASSAQVKLSIRK